MAKPVVEGAVEGEGQTASMPECLFWPTFTRI